MASLEKGGTRCPLFGCEVYHKLTSSTLQRKALVRWYMERQFPSVWAADSLPTLDDIDSWKVTLTHLVSELELRFGLPFSWKDLGSMQPGVPDESCPTWTLFSHGVFAAYYAAESVRQSAHGKCTGEIGTGEKLVSSVVFQSVFREYFGQDGMAEYNPTCVRVLNTNQARVWAMLVVLYTLGVVAYVVESDKVAQRVQSVVDMLWPCMKEIALAN